MAGKQRRLLGCHSEAKRAPLGSDSVPSAESTGLTVDTTHLCLRGPASLGGDLQSLAVFPATSYKVVYHIGAARKAVGLAAMSEVLRLDGNLMHSL